MADNIEKSCLFKDRDAYIRRIGGKKQQRINTPYYIGIVLNRFALISLLV